MPLTHEETEARRDARSLGADLARNLVGHVEAAAPEYAARHGVSEAFIQREVLAEVLRGSVLGEALYEAGCVLSAEDTARRRGARVACTHCSGRGMNTTTNERAERVCPWCHGRGYHGEGWG